MKLIAEKTSNITNFFYEDGEDTGFSINAKSSLMIILYKNEKIIELKIKIRFPFNFYVLISFLNDGKVEKANVHTPLIGPYITYESQNNFYEIFAHRGGFESIFLDGEQIAYVKKNIVEYRNKTQLQIIYNSNIDLQLLILLFCILNGEALENDLGTVSFNLLIYQRRKFDLHWKPKD